jgi:hypothetical protein
VCSAQNSILRRLCNTFTNLSFHLTSIYLILCVFLHSSFFLLYSFHSFSFESLLDTTNSGGLIYWIASRVRITLRLAVYRQSVRLGYKPLETHDQNIYSPTAHLRSQSLCNTLSDERMGLPFTIATGPRQRSHSLVRVSGRDSWPHFIVSDSGHHQPRGSGPRIYIPQEQGGPIIPPGTRFSFRRLLRLAGLRWRYSIPPPHRRIASTDMTINIYYWY